MKRVKMWLAILCGLLCCLNTSAFEVDGFYYEPVEPGSSFLTVTSGGNYSGNIVIPQEVIYNGKTYTVTKVGDYAFQGCCDLTSVNIPNSVTTIGGLAFNNCDALTSINIPSSVTTIGNGAFDSCDALTSINIPSSVTTIEHNPFASCPQLSTIEVEVGNTTFDSRNNCNAIIETATNTLWSGCKNTIIPNSVTTIRCGAFYDCTSLTSINIPNSITTIESQAFDGCDALTSINIPSSVTTIEHNPFASCPQLSTITVEEGNTTFDSRNNCNAIIETATNTLWSGCKNTTIPNSVTTIGDQAFRGCYDLTSINIPNSVTTIGYAAFMSCKALTSISIPKSVTTIEHNPFTNCPQLSTITVEEGNTTFDSRNNCNAIIETATNTLWSGCKNTTIPNSVTTIGDDAFMDCYDLTSINIPNSVTTIGNAAFMRCDLGSINIPSSVTTIENCAFYDCTYLMSINIPNSVRNIGNDAFGHLSNLRITTIKSTTPPNVNGDPFSGSKRQILQVPEGCAPAYQSVQPWNQFSSIIEELGDSNLPFGTTTIINGQFPDDTPWTLMNIRGNKTIYYDMETNRIKCGVVNSYNDACFWTFEGNLEKGFKIYNKMAGPQKIMWAENGNDETPLSMTNIVDTQIEGKANTFDLDYQILDSGYWFKLHHSKNSYLNDFGNKGVLKFWSSDYAKHDDGSKIVFVLNNNDLVFDVTSKENLEVAVIGCTNKSDIIIPSEIRFNGQIYNVTSIRDQAFYNCDALTSIKIPKSVTTIGRDMFVNCPQLSTITVDKGNTIFDSRDNCNAIIETASNTLRQGCKNTAIPNSVTTIGSGAFQDCTALTSINIPKSVTTIGLSAFRDCTALTSINIPNSVTTIDLYAFWGCTALTSINIPNSVTTIGDRVFYNCTALTSVNIPKSVTTIEHGAFWNCTALTSINIPNSVTSIERRAFTECDALTSINIPNSVTTIGDGAFGFCDALTSINISSSVTTIGQEAFKKCDALSSIIVDKKNKNFDSRQNCNALIKTETNELLQGCKNTVIPTSITTIGDNAFFGLEALKSINIPSSVTTIKSYAFAFSGLKTVTLPESIKTIETGAFCRTPTLDTIIVKATTPLSILGNPFDSDKSHIILQVPKGCKAAYQSAECWKDFPIIEERSFTNALSIGNIEGFAGERVVLPVGLDNFDGITTFQFDLYLPEGVSVAIERAKPIITLAGRTNSDFHSISSRQQPDGSLRVICLSTSNMTFSGNSGKVLDIALNISPEIQDGEYTISMDNIVLATPYSERITQERTSSTLYAQRYILGDVNNDRIVDVTDITGVVNLILGNTNQNLNTEAADMNQDSFIDVTDITGVVNIILGNTNFYSPKINPTAKGLPFTNEGSCLEVLPFTLGSNEEKKVPVLINTNGDQFCQAQFDLYLPEGMTVKTDHNGKLDIQTGSLSNVHTIAARVVDEANRHIKVIVTSMSNDNFSGDRGDIAVLTLCGAPSLKEDVHEITLEQTVLARSNTTSVRPLRYTASVISGQPSPRNMVLKGHFTPEVAEKLYSALGSKHITSVDLTQATVDANTILKTGNPNTLFYLADGMLLDNENNVVADGICENLQLTDGYDFETIQTFIAGTATYYRNISQEGWHAVCLPYAAEIPNGTTVEQFYRLDAPQRLAFFENVADMQANMPYIFKASTNVEFHAENVKVSAGASMDKGLFNGTLSRVPANSTVSKFQVDNNGLNLQINTTQTEIPAFRAYLTADITGNSIKIIHDGVTGIDNVNAQNICFPVDVYTFNGQLVKKQANDLNGLAKGIYIINGQKVVR